MRTSQPLGFHVMMRLVNGAVIAPTPEGRRTVAAIVLDKARSLGRLLCFGEADSHMHLLLVVARLLAGKLTRRIANAIKKRLHRDGSGFADPYYKPVWNQHHLGRAFTYILDQCKRHGLPWDPLRESTNLPDLLGMRVGGTYTVRNVRELLPRVDRTQLLECLGLAELAPLDPADEPLDQLAPAAISAGGLIEARLNRRARQAAVAVAGRRCSTVELASRLGVSPRTIIRDRQQPADPRLVTAIRLQFAARAQLPSPPLDAFVPPLDDG